MKRTQNSSSHSTENENTATPHSPSTSALWAVCLTHDMTEPTTVKHYLGLKRISYPFMLSGLAGKHATKPNPVKLQINPYKVSYQCYHNYAEPSGNRQ